MSKPVQNVRFPQELFKELKKEAEVYDVPTARYMRAILQHRKLMDMGNPEFVKSLFNRK